MKMYKLIELDQIFIIFNAFFYGLCVIPHLWINVSSVNDVTQVVEVEVQKLSVTCHVEHSGL